MICRRTKVCQSPVFVSVRLTETAPELSEDEDEEEEIDDDEEAIYGVNYEGT